MTVDPKLPSPTRNRTLRRARQLVIVTATIGLISMDAHSAPSNTGTQSQTVTACFPSDCNALADFDWGLGLQETISIPKFDPAIGDLSSVEVSMSARVVQLACLENTGQNCVSVAMTSGYAVLFGPSPSNVPLVTGLNDFVVGNTTNNLPQQYFFGPSNGHDDCQVPQGPPADGTCSGGDHITLSSDLVDEAGQFTLTAPSEIAAWIGGSGSGVVDFSGTGIGSVTVSGGPNFSTSVSYQSNARIEVTYHYTPAETGTGYCFGDGTQGACPCGAIGAAGRGCPNTNGNGNGALLRGAGLAAAGADTFCLTIEDGAPNKPGIVFQGSSAQNYPNGLGTLANASGLLCVVPAMRGNVIFLDGTGGALAADFLGQPFGATAQAPGSTTYYQFWFRDTGNPCQNAPANSAAFNFSNAVEVDWMP